MKRIIVFVSLISIIASGLLGQDIIYSVFCEKDGQNTQLDSITFERLSDSISFKLDNLPTQVSYNINLSTQEIETPSAISTDYVEDNFIVIRNIPGELSFTCSNKNIGDINLVIYNIKGQKLFSQSIKENELLAAITVHAPYSGVYILNIQSALGSSSFKMIGSGKENDFGYSLNLESQTKINTTLKSALIEKTDDISFQIGDSLQVISYKDGYNSYPVIFSVQNLDTLNLLMETNPSSFLEVNGIRYQLNKGHNLWFSEMDCGANDIYAHGLYLTSDISILVHYPDELKPYLQMNPSGHGNMLVFNLFNKYYDLVPGQYNFIDEVSCHGMITDDGIEYTMHDTAKYASSITEMNDPTFYALNADLPTDWDAYYANPTPEVGYKILNFFNSRMGIKEGYVNIEKDVDTYFILFDCIDNDDNVISGQYNGELEYIPFGI